MRLQHIRFAKGLSLNYFRRQEPRFFSRRILWKAKQTQMEFVKLEEILIGKKMTLIGGGMNSEKVSKFHPEKFGIAKDPRCNGISSRYNEPCKQQRRTMSLYGYIRR
ncbi:MAG: hypothetical protein K1000chlam2_00886 [Chlamydiae bacterium]|nr:hypothetical protein [Chlamydiota bacterium]